MVRAAATWPSSFGPVAGRHANAADIAALARRVSLIFGVVTMASGLVGVPMGAWLGAALIERYPRAHAVICGVGLLVSAPAMALGMLLARDSFYAPFALMFFGEVALNLNWAIVADMSLVRPAIALSVFRLYRSCS